MPLQAFPGNPTDGPPAWPKWHLDAANDSASPADTSMMAGFIAWKSQVVKPSAGTTNDAAPVVDSDDNVFVVSSSGALEAFSGSGAGLWSQQLDIAASSSPAGLLLLSDNSLVATTSYSGSAPNLYHFSRSGALLYSAAVGDAGFDAWPTTSGPDLLSANASSAMAFTVSSRGSLVEEALGELPSASVHVGIACNASGESYWGSEGVFFGLTTSTLVSLASWPSGGVDTLPDLSDAGLTGKPISDLAVGSAGSILAYSAWEQLDQAAQSYTVNGVLTALSSADGGVLWSVPLPGAALPLGWTPLPSDFGNASPAVDNSRNAVYVGNGDGLRSIDELSGAVNWLFPSANVSSSPAIGGDGTVFFGTEDGTFYAVQPNGSLRFELSFGAPISSPPAIDSVGTVYFLCDDGNLYAIR